MSPLLTRQCQDHDHAHGHDHSHGQPETKVSTKPKGQLTVIPFCHVNKILTRRDADTNQLVATGVEGTISDYPSNDVGPIPALPLRTRYVSHDVYSYCV